MEIPNAISLDIVIDILNKVLKGGNADVSYATTLFTHYMKTEWLSFTHMLIYLSYFPNSEGMKIEPSIKKLACILLGRAMQLYTATYSDLKCGLSMWMSQEPDDRMNAEQYIIGGCYSQDSYLREISINVFSSVFYFDSGGLEDELRRMINSFATEDASYQDIYTVLVLTRCIISHRFAFLKFSNYEKLFTPIEKICFSVLEWNEKVFLTEEGMTIGRLVLSIISKLIKKGYKKDVFPMEFLNRISRIFFVGNDVLVEKATNIVVATIKGLYKSGIANLLKFLLETTQVIVDNPTELNLIALFNIWRRVLKFENKEFRKLQHYMQKEFIDKSILFNSQDLIMPLVFDLLESRSPNDIAVDDLSVPRPWQYAYRTLEQYLVFRNSHKDLIIRKIVERLDSTNWVEHHASFLVMHLLLTTDQINRSELIRSVVIRVLEAMKVTNCPAIVESALWALIPIVKRYHNIVYAQKPLIDIYGLLDINPGQNSVILLRYAELLNETAKTMYSSLIQGLPQIGEKFFEILKELISLPFRFEDKHYILMLECCITAYKSSAIHFPSLFNDFYKADFEEYLAKMNETIETDDQEIVSTLRSGYAEIVVVTARRLNISLNELQDVLGMLVLALNGKSSVDFQTIFSCIRRVVILMSKKGSIDAVMRNLKEDVFRPCLSSDDDYSIKACCETIVGIFQEVDNYFFKLAYEYYCFMKDAIDTKENIRPETISDFYKALCCVYTKGKEEDPNIRETEKYFYDESDLFLQQPPQMFYTYEMFMYRDNILVAGLQLFYAYTDIYFQMNLSVDDQIAYFNKTEKIAEILLRDDQDLSNFGGIGNDVLYSFLLIMERAAMYCGRSVNLKLNNQKHHKVVSIGLKRGRELKEKALYVIGTMKSK